MKIPELIITQIKEIHETHPQFTLAEIWKQAFLSFAKSLPDTKENRKHLNGIIARGRKKNSLKNK